MKPRGYIIFLSGLIVGSCSVAVWDYAHSPPFITEAEALDHARGSIFWGCKRDDERRKDCGKYLLISSKELTEGWAFGFLSPDHRQIENIFIDRHDHYDSLSAYDSADFNQTDLDNIAKALAKTSNEDAALKAIPYRDKH